MLITGALIVRFANSFVGAFREAKDFVLCANFIWDNGGASRYILFQQQNKVYYHEITFSLNSPDGRVRFARHLYNLLFKKLDEGQNRNADNDIRVLNEMVQKLNLKSMHTKDAAGRKRARTSAGDGDGAGSGSGGDHAQLRARGYEVKPEVIVDDDGIKWEPTLKSPDHILTVYRPLESGKEFIAKKVREESNELEILRYLDTIQPKSDHIIQLIESFHGWAILPKLTTVDACVEVASEQFDSKVVQVCLGLIDGVTYLHKCRIAHRDIKPDNVVVDGDFCLKIIDFDVAMRVKDEDEEVDGRCGTEHWMAPEVEQNFRHSPIRADRWACGRVIIFLLDRFKEKDERLRAFARKLMVDNPELRPPLLEWRNSTLAPTFSDVGNAWGAVFLKARQDRVEVFDGEEHSTPPRFAGHF
ncbi:kinase-like domain-containing protein [Russula brevipes]|nr:kinase-like domain-containing protein [Russula brevipes]